MNFINKNELFKKRQRERQRQIQIHRQRQLDEKKTEFENNRNILNSYNKLNKPFSLKEKYNSIIPLNLYTCWHTKDLPPYISSNCQSVINQNPEFKHHLFYENECFEFVKNNFDIEVSNAYNALIPCSYKSDLWRFCILYKNGGIYYDIKFNCRNGFKFIHLTENELFVRDRPENCTLTGLIVSKPNNQILKKCIDQIVLNVKNNYYGINGLYPTGPGLLGKYFTEEERNRLTSYFLNTCIQDKLNVSYIVYNNIIILQYDENKYRSEQGIYQKNKYYRELWYENKIYETNII